MGGIENPDYLGDFPSFLNESFSLGNTTPNGKITFSYETLNKPRDNSRFGGGFSVSCNQTWLGTEIANCTSRISDLYSPSIDIVILLYFLYGTICFIALTGNLVVLWLILGSKRMWTVTNMFISNLAMADIIMAVFMPFHVQAALYQRWDLPEWLCPICPFVQILSLSMSVFTLTCIALHRYRGIITPLQVPMSKLTAAGVILCMWAICTLIALPTGMDYTVIYYANPDESFTIYCQNVWWSPVFRVCYNLFVTITQYFFPLVIIIYAYARMTNTLWNTPTPGNQEQSRDVVLLQRKKKVTKMLMVVVLLFGVCWLPYQTYNFLVVLFPGINNFPYINMVWFATHWLAMSNSCCNPFIYGIYNEKFKQEFRRRFRCLEPLQDPRRRQSNQRSWSHSNSTSRYSSRRPITSRTTHMVFSSFIQNKAGEG